MCGIVGFHGNGCKKNLQQMNDAIAHRGPDGEGFYIDSENKIFLGHRRLAIVDFVGGVQPMSDASERVTIVYNGEIYNHKELRIELERLGHVFKSDHSDTEVLVYGYIEWGRDLLNKLNGMFAFCIWDKKRKELFLARDRFGEKPLFWSKNKDGFAFGSELGVMQACKFIQKDIDNNALKKYLAYGYIPAPQTIFRNIQKLEAGSWITYSLESKILSKGTYWKFQIETTGKTHSENELMEELRYLIIRAVKMRLMGDVPVGIFLSGGIDSSIIAACATKERNVGKIKSFTIGFEEESFDETIYARQISKLFDTSHFETVFTLPETIKILSSVVEKLDEPLGDPSILPTYLLCSFAKQKVKVALTGDGGDELFAGYDTFAAIPIARFYQKFSAKPIHNFVKILIDYMPKSERNMSFDFKLRRALSGLDNKCCIWNPTWMAPMNCTEMSKFFKEEINPEEVYEDAICLWNSNPQLSIEDRSLEFYVKFYLQNNILTKSDRASMMNGLETRAPFLDPEVVDFVRKLPYKFKFNRGTRKYILKRSFDNLLPSNIIHRKKKGFGIPINSWIRDLPISREVANNMHFDVDYLSLCIKEHKTKLQDHRLFLWNWKIMEDVMNARKRILDDYVIL